MAAAAASLQVSTPFGSGKPAASKTPTRYCARGSPGNCSLCTPRDGCQCRGALRLWSALRRGDRKRTAATAVEKHPDLELTSHAWL